VGEIIDEDDAGAPAAVRRGDGWDLDAALRIDEIALETGLRLPDEDEYDTLAGLILHRLGRFAVPGDAVEVDLPATLDADAPAHAGIEVLSLPTSPGAGVRRPPPLSSPTRCLRSRPAPR
jgi:CBS domain containing-hemolysin-like protein